IPVDIVPTVDAADQHRLVRQALWLLGTWFRANLNGFTSDCFYDRHGICATDLSLTQGHRRLRPPPSKPPPRPPPHTTPRGSPCSAPRPRCPLCLRVRPERPLPPAQNPPTPGSRAVHRQAEPAEFAARARASNPPRGSGRSGSRYRTTDP